MFNLSVKEDYMITNYAEEIRLAEETEQDLSYYFTTRSVNWARLTNVVRVELDRVIRDICSSEDTTKYKLNDKYLITLTFDQWDNEHYTSDDIRTVLKTVGINKDIVITGFIEEHIYTYYATFNV